MHVTGNFALWNSIARDDLLQEAIFKNLTSPYQSMNKSFNYRRINELWLFDIFIGFRSLVCGLNHVDTIYPLRTLSLVAFLQSCN